jgi:hypothetical protein
LISPCTALVQLSASVTTSTSRDALAMPPQLCASESTSDLCALTQLAVADV